MQFRNHVARVDAGVSDPLGLSAAVNRTGLSGQQPAGLTSGEILARTKRPVSNISRLCRLAFQPRAGSPLQGALFQVPQ
jgi:hypothetical protein